MDDPRDFPAAGQEVTLSSPARHSLEDLRIAIVADDAADLTSLLLERGAQVTELHDPELDIVVLDTAADDDTRRDWLDDQLMSRVDAGRVQLVSRWQCLQYLGEQGPLVRSLFTASMLAELLGVEVTTIRGWHRRGLIQPVSCISKLPYYDFMEVSAARQLATLVDLGIPPATIKKNLQQLARWLPDVDRPLAQLSMIAEGSEVLLRQGCGLVEPGGQRRIDFDHGADPLVADEADSSPAILRFETMGENKTESVSLGHPAEFMALAADLEEAGETAEAVAVYRSMHLAVGATAESCLRLGELLYRQGEVDAARERYYCAIELDDDLVEARTALGCVLAELGQLDLAISAFEGALDYHPDYADVHFHLARALESTGDTSRALRHWERFVQLTPAGPWLEEARSRITVLKSAASRHAGE